MDLCIILGNLLDNAQEACCRMEGDTEDRFIDVEILFKKSFLIIKVTNSYNGQYILKENQYESVKKASISVESDSPTFARRWKSTTER